MTSPQVDVDRQATPSADELRTDRERRHVIEKILTQLVDISVGVNALLEDSKGHRRPSSYRESFALAAEAGVLPSDLAGLLGLSAGMCSVLTHEYGQIDLDLVARAVPAGRQGFGAYVRLVRDALIEAADG